MPIGLHAIVLLCIMLASTFTSFALRMTNTSKHKQPVHIMKTIEPAVCRIRFNGEHWFCNKNVTSLGKSTRKPLTKLKKCNVYPTSLSSYSGDYNEDRDLYDNFFCNKINGTFFEVDALDGVFQSDTKFFEELGWVGGLATAYYRNMNDITAYRNATTNKLFAEGICQSAGRMGLRFASNKKGDLQSILSVPCRPLGEMMRETLKRMNRNKFDFCSISVDGGEEEVLKTMDWNITVDVWVIEMKGENTTKDESVRNLMLKNDYVNISLPLVDNHNVFFMRKGCDYCHADPQSDNVGKSPGNGIDYGNVGSKASSNGGGKEEDNVEVHKVNMR